MSINIYTCETHHSVTTISINAIQSTQLNTTHDKGPIKLESHDLYTVKLIIPAMHFYYKSQPLPYDNVLYGGHSLQSVTYTIALCSSSIYIYISTHASTIYIYAYSYAFTIFSFSVFPYLKHH